jgi:hypothetical protein
MIEKILRERQATHGMSIPNRGTLQNPLFHHSDITTVQTSMQEEKIKRTGHCGFHLGLPVMLGTIFLTLWADEIVWKWRSRKARRKERRKGSERYR